MATTFRQVWVIAQLGLALVACGSREETSKTEKPAKVESVAYESELLKLILTPQAEIRLGLEKVSIGIGSIPRVLSAHGEIVVPAADGGVPTSAQTDLAALAGNQVRADGDIARARAEVAIAEKLAARADALVREEAGSVRSRDEAQSALIVARANLSTAQAQRALLGTPLAAIGREGVLWVRVAVFAGNLASIEGNAPALVRNLGGALAISAHPVNAPPSANPAVSTVDLYYALPNPGGVFRIGQRVAVDLPTSSGDSGLMVPATAILRDIYGGEWVYVMTGPHSYERRRIEIIAVEGDQAMLGRGLARGDKVVTVGAAELFGTEFGAQ